MVIFGQAIMIVTSESQTYKEETGYNKMLQWPSYINTT